MASETVTVIVPTRNSERTLEACLTSVRQQTHRDVELIVVDNHSSDRTREIAARHADVVETWGPERSAQRNRGASLASGEVLLFLDSDQILEQRVVAEAVSVLAVSAETAALVIPEVAFGEGFWGRCRSLEKRLYLGDRSVEAARVFRRAAFDEVGGYDESLTGNEDWDLPDRMEEAGYEIGRISALVHHDEGRVRLVDSYRKKRYYGAGSTDYLKRPASKRRLVRLSLFSNPRELLAAPHLAIGLYILKAVDVSGYLVGRRHGHASVSQPETSPA